VTGFPGFISKRLVQHIARSDPKGRIYVLVLAKQVEEARHFLAKAQVKAEIFEGDVVNMHLGLSGPEYQRLCDEVTDIFHLAAISYLGVSREVAWRVNVDGTRNVIELASECPRLH
jgi:nucleoside-diphosphate-sugar epimerase